MPVENDAGRICDQCRHGTVPEQRLILTGSSTNFLRDDTGISMCRWAIYGRRKSDLTKKEMQTLGTGIAIAGALESYSGRFLRKPII